MTGTVGPDGKGQRVAQLIRVTADNATGFATAIDGSQVVLLGTASTWSEIGDPSAEQVDLNAPWTCGPAGAYVDDCVPAEGISHTIGTVQFGSDGSLYVGSGDASTWTTVDPRALRSLDPDSLAGKILRIDPITGEGLPGNPYGTVSQIVIGRRFGTWVCAIHIDSMSTQRLTKYGSEMSVGVIGRS